MMCMVHSNHTMTHNEEHSCGECEQSGMDESHTNAL